MGEKKKWNIKTKQIESLVEFVYQQDNQSNNGKPGRRKAMMDEGWAWMVCLACLVGNLTNASMSLSFGVILPSLKQHYGQGTGLIAFVGSILNGIVLISMPMAAVATRLFGLRTVYIVGSVLSATAVLVSTFSPNISMMIVTYGILNAVGLGLVSLVTAVACNYYFEKRRALAVGIGKTGISIGSFISPPLSNQILNSYDWKAVLYLYSSVMLLGALFGCLIIPLPSEEGQTEDCKKQAKRETCDTGSSTIFENVKRPSDCVNRYGEEICIQRGELLLLHHNASAAMNSKKCQNTFDIALTEQHMKVLHGEPKHLTNNCTKSNNQHTYSLAVHNHSDNECKADAENCNSGSFKPCGTNTQKNELKQTKTMLPSIYKSLDLSLWGSPSFLFLTLSITLGHFGWLMYFMFVPSMLMEQHGFSSANASLVLTSTGIANTIGRIVAGLMMDHPRINPSLLMAAAFMSSGICLSTLPFIANYAMLIIVGSTLGFVAAPYNVGLAIVLGNMLESERVASAFGKIGFIQGIGVLAGPTISGYVYDATKDYRISFVVAGISYIAAGLFCWVSNILHSKCGNSK